MESAFIHSFLVVWEKLKHNAKLSQDIFINKINYYLKKEKMRLKTLIHKINCYTTLLTNTRNKKYNHFLTIPFYGKYKGSGNKKIKCMWNLNPNKIVKLLHLWVSQDNFSIHHTPKSDLHKQFETQHHSNKKTPYKTLLYSEYLPTYVLLPTRWL